MDCGHNKGHLCTCYDCAYRDAQVLPSPYLPVCVCTNTNNKFNIMTCHHLLLCKDYIKDMVRGIKYAKTIKGI